MLVAAAVPSLGVTFLVILSAFSGAGITKATLIGLMVAVGFVQIVIIGYANVTRPEVFS
ncbi:MAG: hypothetical protein HZA83_01455 [Thaumarchaeota archaeon]|nr:hypothetical protein [Nitrososphaerota archaeon]